MNLNHLFKKMNIRNIVSVALLTSLGLGISASAQEAEKTAALMAMAVQKGKTDTPKPYKGIIASHKAGTIIVQKDADTTLELVIDKSFDTFYVMTPPVLRETLGEYAAEDFTTARAKLHKVRKQLENWRGIPEGPFIRAYRAELECAVRQLDFAGAAKVAKEFPGDVKKILTPQDEAMVKAVEMLEASLKNGATAPEKFEEAVLKYLKEHDAKAITPAIYGMMYYAIGRAYEGALPQEEITAHVITDANKAKANKAINAYCVAGMSTHGAKMELPIDAMTRAQYLLWSMPGVQAEVKKYGKLTSPSKFKAATPNFQDAVALAYILVNVYGVDPASSKIISAAAELYSNTKAK